MNIKLLQMGSYCKLIKCFVIVVTHVLGECVSDIREERINKECACVFF